MRLKFQKKDWSIAISVLVKVKGSRGSNLMLMRKL